MKRLAALVFGAALATALAPNTPAMADDPPCNAWEVEYTLAAQLRLSDTAMGAGDGLHTIGPGKVVLHFDNVNGAPGGSVELMTYEMTDQFTINARVLGLGITIADNTT